MKYIHTLDKNNKNAYPNFWLFNQAILSLVEGLLNMFLLLLNKRLCLTEWYLDYTINFQLRKLSHDQKEE